MVHLFVRPRRVRLRLLCALLISAALAPACIDDLDPGDPVPTVEPGTATATAIPAPRPSAYEELLGLIPDTPETRQQTTIIDFARIHALRGFAYPADPSDPAQKDEYLAQLVKVPTGGVGTGFLSGFGQFARLMNEVRLEHHLGYRRVDQEVVAGTPPEQYFAVRGLFDPAAAEQAIAACTGCPQPGRREAQGTPYLSWGEDYFVSPRSRLTPPVFDELGRGGRYVITDRVVMRTLWTDGIVQMIAAQRGGPSLAQSEGHRLLARGLERGGAYTALISEDTQAAEPGAAGPLLAPYLLLAAGAGQEQGSEPYTVIVLVHASEAEAQENAVLLPRRIAETESDLAREPWSNVFTSVNVQVDGRVLVAKLGGSPVVGAQFFTYRDPLLLHR